MTTTRMTNDHRRIIGQAAISAAFNPQAEAMAEVEDGLARQAYAAIYSVEERSQADAMPSYWLRQDECLRYNVGGFRITLRTMRDHLRVPYGEKGSRSGSYGCHTSHGTIEAGELCDKIVAHANAKEALKAKRGQTERKLFAMLGSMTSLKKLSEVWPEGLPFYQKFMTKNPAVMLPAIRTDEINAALGLTEQVPA